MNLTRGPPDSRAWSSRLALGFTWPRRKEIAENKHGRFDSFLILQQDKLLFESYYSRGRINLPHPQASTTKAYTALLLGRAIQLGYLTMDDLDKPLIKRLIIVVLLAALVASFGWQFCRV